MAISMVIRRTGDYKDTRLQALRNQGVPLLKKHGATSHRFGYYQSGPYTGQILIVLTYPDLETHERAMQGMSEDTDWKRVAAEVDKIAPLQESYLTVITEEQ
jgi:hypothetical protein